MTFVEAVRQDPEDARARCETVCLTDVIEEMTEAGYRMIAAGLQPGFVPD